MGRLVLGGWVKVVAHFPAPGCERPCFPPNQSIVLQHSVRSAAMSAITIKRQISIEFSTDQKPWIINDVETTAGKEYICINKRDSGFRRFATGDVKSTCTFAYVAELRRLRTQASLKASAPKEEANALFDEPDAAAPAAENRQRKKARLAVEGGRVPPVVTIMMPGYDSADGDPQPAKAAKVLFDINEHSNVKLELEQSVLQHLRGALLAEPAAAGPKLPAHCSWRKDKGCFVVRKMVQGKRITKTFRPDGEDEEAKDQALTLAEQWLAACELEVEAAAAAQPIADKPAES